MVEKVIAKKLSPYCEDYSKLYAGQIRVWKNKSAIDAIVTPVYTIEEKLEKKKLATALFIDVKGVFDYVSKSWLFTCIIELGINNDLMNWTGSYLMGRKIQLVIDKYNNKEKDIKIGNVQGFLLLLIFFLIYNSGVFSKVSATKHMIMTLSFIDNLKFIFLFSLIKQIVKSLEEVTKI